MTSKFMNAYAFLLLFVFCSNALADDFFCVQFLAPLEVKELVKQVDFNQLDQKELTITLSLDTEVYDSTQLDILKDQLVSGFFLKPNERALKTDYGFAVLTVEELRDWQLFSSVINDPARAKALIEKVANTEGFYPNGITRESADWLRWSVFAHWEAIRKLSKKNLEPLGEMNGLFDMLQSMLTSDRVRRKEFRRLIREKMSLYFRSIPL